MTSAKKSEKSWMKTLLLLWTKDPAHNTRPTMCNWNVCSSRLEYLLTVKSWKHCQTPPARQPYQLEILFWRGFGNPLPINRTYCQWKKDTSTNISNTSRAQVTPGTNTKCHLEFFVYVLSFSVYSSQVWWSNKCAWLDSQYNLTNNPVLQKRCLTTKQNNSVYCKKTSWIL